MPATATKTRAGAVQSGDRVLSAPLTDFDVPLRSAYQPVTEIKHWHSGVTGEDHVVLTFPDGCILPCLADKLLDVIPAAEPQPEPTPGAPPTPAGTGGRPSLRVTCGV